MLRFRKLQIVNLTEKNSRRLGHVKAFDVARSGDTQQAGTVVLYVLRQAVFLVSKNQGNSATPTPRIRIKISQYLEDPQCADVHEGRYL